MFNTAATYQNQTNCNKVRGGGTGGPLKITNPGPLCPQVTVPISNPATQPLLNEPAGATHQSHQNNVDHHGVDQQLISTPGAGQPQTSTPGANQAIVNNVMMKQILETHAPDGREVDVRPLLSLVEDILNRATQHVDFIVKGTQAQTESMYSGEMLFLLGGVPSVDAKYLMGRFESGQTSVRGIKQRLKEQISGHAKNGGTVAIP
ncbi:hypothetical protein DITRI_Ditri16bG0139600 [Diplodiscus trichospermus]